MAVGDYQIQIFGNNRSFSYNVHDVKCQADFCGGKCTSSEPGLRRFRNRTQPKYNERKYFIVGDNMEITITSTISDSTRGFGKISIGNVDLKNLVLKEAICDFELRHTYACTGCGENPYVVFEAYRFKTPGVIYFNTNCSLTQNYISCVRMQLIKLTMKQHYEYCYIELPTINRTFHISMDIENVGVIHSVIPQGASTTDYMIESAKNILGSGDFKNSFTYIVGGITFFGVFGNIIYKIAILYCSQRTIRHSADINGCYPRY